MTIRIALGAFVLLGLGACTNRTPAPGGGAADPPYEMTCQSSNTATSAQVYCVRTDTRTGDIQRVDIMKLPISNGPTASAAGPPGRYRTECTATSTDTRSDFYCVRLNTDSGEMMLINLQKIGQLPHTEK